MFSRRRLCWHPTSAPCMGGNGLNLGGGTNPLPIFLHPLLYYGIVELALSRRASALEPRFFVIIIVYAFRWRRNRSSTPWIRISTATMEGPDSYTYVRPLSPSTFRPPRALQPPRQCLYPVDSAESTHHPPPSALAYAPERRQVTPSAQSPRSLRLRDRLAQPCRRSAAGRAGSS